MKRSKNIIIYSVLIFIIPLSPFSIGKEKKGELLLINKEFCTMLSSIPPIIRDDFLNDKLNRIVLSRGIVKSIDEVKRYRKNYRIILINQEALKMNLNIKYYIFVDSKDTVSMLTENVNFEFSGQFMAYTPINSARDSYIFDIVLEKGAILVE